MPQAIAQWVATKVVIAASTVVTGNALSVVAAVAYYGTQIAVTAAIAAGAQALAGGTPDPETAKGSLKQPLPPRIRGYGRRRLGGSYLLWEALKNFAYDVIAIHDGQIAGPVEQVWLHDNVVALTGAGFVIKSPDYGGGDSDLIHVETRLGLDTETAYSAIVAALSPSGVWTAAHRADGIATLGADYRHAKKENLLADYPNGDPRWGITARLSPVWDPRDEAQMAGDPGAPYDPAWGWTGSSNLALQILDFCRHPTGMAMDFETEIAPALDHWRGEADICDEPIPLKGGGSEPRYWGSGYYALPDDPQNTLDKMLAACDGRLLRDEFGVWRLWVGKVRTPTVWLTDEDIADYDIQGDAAAFDVINELVPSFCSEAHKWTMVEATPWRNQPDVDLRGRILTSPFPVEWANSASLVRRLAKRESSRQLTPVRGALVGKLSCVRALGQRWIGIDLADLDLHQAVVECEKGGKTAFSRAAVDLPFSLIDPDVDEWDPETEEDGSGVAPDRPDTETLGAPTLLTAVPFEASLGDTNGVRLTLTGSGPDREDLTWWARWRVAGDTSWSVAEVTDETAGTGFSGLSGFVASVPDLSVAIGYETGGSSGVQWSIAMSVDTATALPPGIPSGLTAYVNDDTIPDAVVECSAPTSANVSLIRFFMGGPLDSFEDAVDIGTEAAAPGSLVQALAIDPPSGGHRFWAVAENGGGAPSLPAGPAEVTIP